MADRAELAKKLAATSDQRLTGLEERVEELAAQVRGLVARVNRSAPDANVQKVLQAASAAQKAAEDATALTRSLEAKYSGLSRAVDEVKAKFAEHDKRLDHHHQWLVARTEDDERAEQHFRDLYKRLKAVEKGLERVTTWVMKLHPGQFKKR